MASTVTFMGIEHTECLKAEKSSTKGHGLERGDGVFTLLLLASYLEKWGFFNG